MNIDIFSGLAVLCSVAILTSTDSCRFDPMRFEPLSTASFDFEIKDGDQFRLDSHCHFGAPCEVRLNGVVLNEDIASESKTASFGPLRFLEAFLARTRQSEHEKHEGI